MHETRSAENLTHSLHDTPELVDVDLLEAAARGIARVVRA
jgi:hypothetical protein